MRRLVDAGLVLRNDQKRGRRGRFSTRRYVVVAVLFFTRATVRHGGRADRRSPNRRRTIRAPNTPYSPPTDAFNWFFGKERNLEAEDDYYKRQQEEKRRREAKRRTQKARSGSLSKGG